MLTKLLAILAQLPDQVVLFVEEGALKNKLLECYLKKEEAHDDILDCVLEASVRIWRTGDVAGQAIEGQLEAEGFHYQTCLALENLTDGELTELLEHLKPHCRIPTKPKPQPARNILRKKNGSGMLGISAAANALGLSRRDLKTLIPCSEIRIAEQDGDKVIEEYYWEKGLIGRFARLGAAHNEGGEANREDVTCIAEWCCDGDRQWARDLISDFLKQRYPGEHPPRE